MASKGVTFGGILVSLALAGLTLAVFAASQLRGPEGSVHKFLIAVAEERYPEVDELSFGTQQEKLVVTRFVSQVFRIGARYQILDVSQRSGRARVGVLFRIPNGSELPWIVSVRRVDRKWLIDAGSSTRPGPTFLN
jgi:hypothetical protein